MNFADIPILNQFFLGRKKNLSEIAASGVAAKNSARANLDLRQFHSESYASQMFAGCYFNGTNYIATEATVYKFTLSSVDGAIYCVKKTGLTPGDIITSWTGEVVLFSATPTFFDVCNKPIDNVGNGGISFTGTGAQDTTGNLLFGDVSLTPSGSAQMQNSSATWNGKDLIIDLSAATIYTLNFQSANFADGMACNICIALQAGTAIDVNITFNGLTGDIISDSGKTAMDTVGGWVTAQRHGTKLYLVGKLK